MKFWLEFFADKRFGWRFKIANFIMGDYLRNHLAVGCLTNLSHIENFQTDDNIIKVLQKRAAKAKKAVIDVMEM